MTQLILGAACGYKTELLEPFCKSLRRNYQGNCILIVNPLTEEEDKFFESYNIMTYELESPMPDPREIQVDRYYYYKECLEQFEEADQILICDIRDVMFQDDPFKFRTSYDLEFFKEPCLFKNCSANFPWVGGIYGQAGMQLVQNEFIICSGTTMGSYAGIMNYCDTMITEMERIRATGRPLYQGEDQPIHNFLVYSKTFRSYTMFANGEGAITTVHHQQQLTFDRKGQLLNKNNEPVPVIHQWDRADALVKVLEKTALEGPL
jgi:hypothetical protein